MDDRRVTADYQRVDPLKWDAAEIEVGKVIKIRGFPAKKKVKLFRVMVSPHRAEYVVTNDLSQDSTQATWEECRVRWKIEQFHRELNQLTGVEACQCRKGRIQLNHIHCALWVWNFLRWQGVQSCLSVYEVSWRP